MKVIVSKISFCPIPVLRGQHPPLCAQFPRGMKVTGMRLGLMVVSDIAGRRRSESLCLLSPAIHHTSRCLFKKTNPLLWHVKPEVTLKLDNKSNFNSQSTGDKDPWGQVSSVPTTCCLLQTTPNPKYQPHCNFHASSMYCDLKLDKTVESIIFKTCCPHQSTVVPARY